MVMNVVGNGASPPEVFPGWTAVADTAPPAWDDRWALQPDLIPKERYTSTEFLKLEYEHLWPRAWQIACREEEIRSPGDFVEYTIGDQSILVVRQADRSVRAFYNTCLHRGTRLARGCGAFATGQIQCPFHGWRWATDGTSTFVLDREEFGAEGMSDEDLRLGQVRTEVWAGFVWITMSPEAPGLMDFLDPLPTYFEPLNFGDMQFVWYKTAYLPANWKTALDAFHEGYHNYGTHPQLLNWADDTAMVYEQFANGHARYLISRGAGPSKRLGLEPGDYDNRDLIASNVEYQVDALKGSLYSEDDLEIARRLRTLEIPDGSSPALEFARMAEANALAKGVRYPRLSDEQKRRGTGIFSVFPNVVLLATLANVLMYRVRPYGLNPDGCIFDVWALRLYPEGTVRSVDRQILPHLDLDRWGAITYQDFCNMSEVTAGMHSRGCRGIKLGLRQEMNIMNMQRQLDTYLRREE